MNIYAHDLKHYEGSRYLEERVMGFGGDFEAFFGGDGEELC